MSVKEVFEEIREFCISHSDELLIQKYSRYFREGFKTRGLSMEAIDQMVGELSGRPGMSLPFILELARELIPDGWYEEGAIAMLLLEKRKKHFSKETFLELDWWFRIGMENWAHTDFMGGRIICVFLEKAIISTSDLSSWLQSDRKYQRRVVPVSLIRPMKSSGKAEPWLDFLEPLMADRERVVHQGMGWFLREAWKKDPHPVEDFLMKYRNTAPRLIFQYATEKMEREQRDRYRRDKGLSRRL
ncbi:MAG: DNA alkylation repair protein [Bacteroidota bacterium]